MKRHSQPGKFGGSGMLSYSPPRSLPLNPTRRGGGVSGTFSTSRVKRLQQYQPAAWQLTIVTESISPMPVRSLQRRRNAAGAPDAPCVGTARTRGSRRGAATIVALAVLAIFAGIMAQQTRRVLMERRQMRDEVAFLQTEKLADAGMLLAQKSKADDPAWTGLTWNLPAGVVHQTNSAVVVITVQEDSCTVVARYPSNAEIPFQVTRTRKLTP